MHEELFCVLEDGATIVTATRRLARVLIQQFHSRQRASGQSTWSMPDILPQEGFLDRLWRNWLLGGATEECPRLLDPLQEQIVWERIILESPAGETLLQIAPTAWNAIKAWQLVHAYRLPLDGRFDAADDWAAFRDWSRAFGKLCQANNWLERARLSDFLLEKIAAGELSPPSKLYLAGFDHLTPQPAAFFESFGALQMPESREYAERIDRCKARDAAEEIRYVAAWARELLEREPETQIGIVVPDLGKSRAQIERIFRQTLDPAGEFGEGRQPFHVSLGPSLDSYPLVRAASLMLDFATGGLSLPEAGVLLRSPFVGGAKEESSQRALLDLKLRKRSTWFVTVAGLHEAAGSCPLLQRALMRLQKEVENLPEQQPADGWARSFSRSLTALGWPGDRALSSSEYQALEKWQQLLSSLAALDIAAAPMSSSEALYRLRQIAERTPFQTENEAAPIQIMGLMEAAGLEFDHLWIMGLNDEALPMPANTNPFLPLSLQREYKLPGCSASNELEVARQQMERLLKSSPDVVISYSEREGDRALSPSPLASAESWRTLRNVSTLTQTWMTTIRAGLVIEQQEDQLAPPVSVDAMQRGGSSLLKDVAACPFRAFAKHRLHARPLEDGQPGLTYQDRGTGVHKALERLWSELRSHSRLLELPPQELHALVNRSVECAANSLPKKLGRTLERRRLESLLIEWLKIEKSRSAFTVCSTEHEHEAVVAGLRVRTRADRVDMLPDGRQLVIDYKTGQIGSKCWNGDRPDEPQLPLYCISSEGPVAGAAFGVLRTGELGFRGLAEHDVSLPASKKNSVQGSNSFEDQITSWKKVLEALAENFRAGLAKVDPKPGACENCGLNALCRIQDFQSYGR